MKNNSAKIINGCNVIRRSKDKYTVHHYLYGYLGEFTNLQDAITRTENPYPWAEFLFGIV